MLDEILELQQKQLDRMEKKIDGISRNVSGHRAEISWIKVTMAAFFSTLMTVIYKVFFK